MEIKKILIANRGEIAVRIIRTCKEMGIKTVALCPKKGNEDQFLETRLADEFYYLDQEGILGYLDQRKIIEIAKRARVDAIHPGYGFLAENGGFADLCQENGIKFIGPRGETLKKVGNKIEAKKIAYKIGFPLLKGPQRAVDEKKCFKMAKKIGPPFLLKAVDGGGGIGIAEIHRIKKGEIIETFRKLKRVTESAFNSRKIFIEKLLLKPRHIEFQILGDGRGKVWHFGERECSIQRRHQKLIEEAPSPLLEKKLRKKMGKLAIKLGEYLKYESLGTVEFLVDQNKNFYFIEVNPRLQVEHPVTEQIFGIDLVEQQIRVARGEKLNLKQKRIKFQGWAMEFRICAEEATKNFQPATGKITNFLFPAGKGIEIHSLLQPGQKIFPYFDSLILKLVVFGKDRKSCIQRVKRAFDEILIEGIPTLIPLHRVILENKNFIEGNLCTSFIEEERILEKLQEIKPKEKVKMKKEVLEKKEMASLIANLYQKLKKGEKKTLKISKWKLAERMEILEE
ncbi:acetyl-CoA carboxylase biotin carboxylase subunit [Patescibacteria group bacterium]|nr:acetyl-CoA carboxylase biotin carboxylase subunit [Patescibacteria group bacterium]